MTFSMLVAEKELLRCFAQGSNFLTLCNLPVDSFDPGCGAMTQIDEKIPDLAKEVILQMLISTASYLSPF
jgi:hypothetical protein